MVVVASLLLLLLVGCGATGGASSTTSGSVSSANASSKLCQSITKVNQSIKKVSTIGSTTTVGEVKADQQKLTAALSVVSKLPGGGGATLSKLESANSQLATAINGLPDSAPIGQASQQLQTFEVQVSKAQADMTKLASTLHCAS